MPDETLFSRLADTIVWCSGIVAESNLGPKMRSPELLPPLLHEGRDDAVCQVGLTRHRIIRQTTTTPRSTKPDMVGGRLMCYFPDADLCCGAAEQESEGFFDIYNTPPWDTWVGYFCDGIVRNRGYDCYLLAYVPKQLISLVAEGILVNPEQCIAWLEDAEVKLSSRLAGL